MSDYLYKTKDGRIGTLLRKSYTYQENLILIMPDSSVCAFQASECEPMDSSEISDEILQSQADILGFVAS
jgi:hypothetical protein